MEPTTLALGALALFLLTQSKGSAAMDLTLTGPRRPVNAGSIPVNRRPSQYAQSKLSELTTRYRGALGNALREQSEQLWPGVPVSAFVGFTSIGARTEDTAPTANRTFHEVGYFQTPAGPASGPAPNPDPRAPHNAWGAIASGDLGSMLLGRPITMRANGWRDLAAIPDQTAVGLVDLWNNLQSIRRILPSALVPRSPSTFYTIACSFAAFSAGPTGASRSLIRANQHVSFAGATTDQQRWDAWLMGILRSWESGANLGTPGTHANAAYTLLRTWQKLAAGRLLAQSVGDDSAWFPEDSQLYRNIEAAITAAAYGGRP